MRTARFFVFLLLFFFFIIFILVLVIIIIVFFFLLFLSHLVTLAFSLASQLALIVLKLAKLILHGFQQLTVLILALSQLIYRHSIRSGGSSRHRALHGQA